MKEIISAEKGRESSAIKSSAGAIKGEEERRRSISAVK